MADQGGFFDTDERLRWLSAAGDPLERLAAVVDFELFRPELDAALGRSDRAKGGRPPYDAVLMFRVLVLQTLYTLSDDQAEYQLRDRLSFMRFAGLSLSDAVPDAKTIWLFREQLTQAGLDEKLFARFDRELEHNGFAARKGQIIDAAIVEAPRQRNTRDENKQIKQTGQAPRQWAETPNKLRQKDVDARWTRKNEVNYFGYKNHLSVDREHKLIRKWAVTDAAVNDSQVFEQILDECNASGEVWADAAYRSEASLKRLKKWGYREHVQRKGVRGRPLTAWEKQGNRTRARVRSRVEHVFGIQAMRATGNLLLRTIGLARARCKIGLRNLSYNIARYVILPRTKASGLAPVCT